MTVYRAAFRISRFGWMREFKLHPMARSGGSLKNSSHLPKCEHPIQYQVEVAQLGFTEGLSYVCCEIYLYASVVSNNQRHVQL